MVEYPYTSWRALALGAGIAGGLLGALLADVKLPGFMLGFAVGLCAVLLLWLAATAIIRLAYALHPEAEAERARAKEADRRGLPPYGKDKP